MNALRRLALVVGGIAVVVVLFVVLRGRGDDGDDEPAARPPATTQTATGTATRTMGTRANPPRPQPPPVTEIRIAVRQGRVLGGFRRATVEQNRRVLLVVSSDVADEVHLHGYDILRPVRRGKAARLAFRARLAGRFEVELEDRGLHIAELEVRP